MAIRTFSPWGHVSKADRASRMQMAGDLSAWAKVKGEPEWVLLVEALRRKDKPEVIRLADALNAKGYDDRAVEHALNCV